MKILIKKKKKFDFQNFLMTFKSLHLVIFFYLFSTFRIYSFKCFIKKKKNTKTCLFNLLIFFFPGMQITFDKCGYFIHQ